MSDGGATRPERPAERHRNDGYGGVTRPGDAAARPATPAATVVLLRDGVTPEVLMLRKNSRIAFGGMWVFPGGRIDAEDAAGGAAAEAAARNAAARETREEAGIAAAPDDFVWFAHWTPPPDTPKRFATWFFAARAAHHDVSVDGGEIEDHQWIAPATALARHAAGAIDLVPPTWVTLHQLAGHASVAAILERLRARPAQVYETRIGQRADGVRVAMWRGDGGYEACDADAPGERHRLVMTEGGFTFENTVDAA